eukprot:730433-Pleurochrysis_carterae.AAC.1
MYIWAAAGTVRLASVVRREHAECRRGSAGSSFGDCGIEVLAEALKVNKTLATLNVECARGLACTCAPP